MQSSAALADKETVAGASHVLPARRRISDRSGLVTGIAFYYMLVFFTGDVYHVATDPAADHGHAPSRGIVGGRQLIRPNG